MTFWCPRLASVVALTFTLLTFTLLASGRAEAQTATAGAARDYSRESAVVEKFSRDVAVEENGTWTSRMVMSVRVQSEAALRGWGILPVFYRTDDQRVDVVYVRVKKASGETVETPAESAQDVSPEVTRAAPMYTDIREKQIPVKGLSVGDLLEYEVKITQFKPEVPGQFWYSADFLRGQVVLEETLKISVPADKYVKVQSPLYKPKISEEGGRKTFFWTTQQTGPVANVATKALPSPLARQGGNSLQPAVQVTTFRSWEEVGRWYAGLQAKQVTVTPAVQARADEITRGMTSNEAKQRALYAYVSMNFRYISISLGAGKYQPHAASEVLGNAYGDCKDKHTLLAALLKAEGIRAWPALIGYGMKLDDSMPSPAQFNHLITVVPDGKNLIWMDTTAEVAPFGLLMVDLRDKKSLVIPDDGIPSLQTTPANPPFPTFQRHEAEATLKADGSLNSHVEAHLRGDSEVFMRTVFRQVAQGEWGQMVERLRTAAGETGQVSNVNVQSEKVEDPLHYSYDYTISKYPGWENHQIVLPVPSMLVQPAVDAQIPPDGFFLGAPGEIEYKATLHLPTGLAGSAPKGRDIHYSFADYRSTYVLEGNTLKIDRGLSIKQSKVQASESAAYGEFAGIVAADGKTMLLSAGANVDVTSAHRPAGDEAERLLIAAKEARKTQDYALANGYLSQVAKINPRQPSLWSEYGFIHLRFGEPDKAIAAFQKEVLLHPEDPAGYRALAMGQEGLGKPKEAADTLRELLKKTPDDADVLAMYSTLLIVTRQYSAIPALLEPVLARKDSPRLRLLLAEGYLKDGHKKEGIDAAQAAVKDGDEMSLNNAAYMLADNEADLVLAQDYATQAVTKAEEETSALKLPPSSEDDFTKVQRLASFWDTLGWVCFRNGDYGQADKLIAASWKLSPREPVGNHLGQVYAKAGKSAEAAATWQAALITPGNRPDTRADIEGHLKAAGATVGQPKVGVLQTNAPLELLNRMRTTKLADMPKQKGEAEFFLLFSTQGLEETSFIAGDQTLRSAEPVLKTAHFNVTFPDSGREKIVRRGVLSCSLLISPSCEMVLVPLEASRKEP